MKPRLSYLFKGWLNALGKVALPIFVTSSFAWSSVGYSADIQYSKPIDLLVNEYNSNQILVLSNASHRVGSVYPYLLDLLRTVGNDPNLKYIVLERFGADDEFYQALSIDTIETVLAKGFLSDIKDRESSLCVSGEWAHVVANIIPKIANLNRTRRQSPVLMRSIDGVLRNDLTFTNNEASVVSGNCSSTQPFYSNLVSINREHTSANHFKQRIWNNLKKTDKVIVIYQYWHTIQNFQQCLPFNEGKNWQTNWGTNWLSKFTQDTPESKNKISVVVFDEKDDYNPDGIFSISKILGLDSFAEDKAMTLNQFKNSDYDKVGIDSFLPTSFVRTYQGGHISQQIKLSEVADGMIWITNSESRFPIGNANQYLPHYCK